MELALNLLDTYYTYILTGLIIFCIILFILLIINSVRISKMSRKYKKLMRGSKDKNIEQLVLEFMSKVDRVEEKSDEVRSLYNDMDKRVNKCIQKVSMMRYKAFEDMGGAALSFSIAMLDSEDDGIILTGIYGREECVTYAKPVDKGVPKYDLSDEEKTVLQDAMKKKLNL